MKKILLIATGGTIASKYTAEGLAPQISADELFGDIFLKPGNSAPLIPFSLLPWTVPMCVQTIG